MSDRPLAPIFHGRSEDGRLKLDDRQKFQELLQRLDGERISITVKKFRRGRSLRQNSWYWSGILPVLAEFCGYEVEELHEGLKARFLKRHEDSPLPTVASTASLSTIEFSDYVERVRQLAAELGCNVPDPGDY